MQPIRSIEDLHAGYRRFKEGGFTAARDRYRHLAEQGQSPSVMLIACCDSRADPSLIFDAGPGELFVVRNVANLVPPPEVDNAFHGTSAAIEFAVTGLGVQHIVVMGHAQCGGVRAYVDGALGVGKAGKFIERWASLLGPAFDTLPKGLDAPEAAEQLERASIRQSIAQLRKFPFVAERETEGTLSLHGAFFGIAHGMLEWMDASEGAFRPIA